MNPERFLIRFISVFALSAAITSAKNTPVQIEQTVEAQFPAALAFSTLTSGEVQVLINVDADGRLADLLVTGYTEKAFADEAVNLLRQWRYRPATVNGGPVGIRLELQIKFVATGRVISLTALEATAAFAQRSMPLSLLRRVCTAAELDHPIEALQTVSPSHPGKAENTPQPSGTTLIDFYVDEEGRIRMPVVMESTNPIYAQAAVGALSQWRFSLPTCRGKPVAVRVQQKFIFAHDPI